MANLTQKDVNIIRTVYSISKARGEAQSTLAKHFGVTRRTIRNWASEIGLSESSTNPTDSKILIYDIETSRAEAKIWWPGKQFVSAKQIKREPRIISIAWKWLGEDEVYDVVWDDDQCDKKLLEEFLVAYNSADMIIGQNNDRFDNRWVNARAAKHGLFVDMQKKSFDLMKQAKRIWRLPSYSMAFMAEFFGVTLKQSHEGMRMWDMIEDGTDAQKAEYLEKMVVYNRGDIVTTEELFVLLRKYMGHKVHFGVLKGGEKYSCPDCGNEHPVLFKTTYTGAGTPQRLMHCKACDAQYKVSNRSYMDFLNRDEDDTRDVEYTQ